MSATVWLTLYSLFSFHVLCLKAAKESVDDSKPAAGIPWNWSILITHYWGTEACLCSKFNKEHSARTWLRPSGDSQTLITPLLSPEKRKWPSMSNTAQLMWLRWPVSSCGCHHYIIIIDSIGFKSSLRVFSMNVVCILVTKTALNIGLISERK